MTPMNPVARGPRIEADRESKKDRNRRRSMCVLSDAYILFVSTCLLMSGFLCRFATKE